MCSRSVPRWRSPRSWPRRAGAATPNYRASSAGRRSRLLRHHRTARPRRHRHQAGRLRALLRRRARRVRDPRGLDRPGRRQRRLRRPLREDQRRRQAGLLLDRRAAGRDRHRRQTGRLHARPAKPARPTIVSRATRPARRCGNGAVDAGFAGASGDGETVFFVTSEALAAADQDSSVDVYERDLAAGTTKLVSAGASSCAPAAATAPSPPRSGASPRTARRPTSPPPSRSRAPTATPATTSTRATWRRARRSSSRAGDSSCLPGCGNSGAVPIFRGSSASGSRVFFASDEPLAAGDEDTATDVYARDLPGGPDDPGLRRDRART